MSRDLSQGVRLNEAQEADAYILVMPEYNHSLPAVLKNAIDTVFFSIAFRHKPAATVGYSLGLSGGVRAVEHLSQILLETEAVPLRIPTLIPFVPNAFDAEGKPTNTALPVTLSVMLDDLAWLGEALKTARAKGEPPPGAFRIRAARTK
jgi:NAD(P)H-dependent FMN reductase